MNTAATAAPPAACSRRHGPPALARLLLTLSLLAIPASAGGAQPPPKTPPGAVNMEFRDTDLPVVLRAICQGAGLDFVLEPNVQGKVTAKLHNTSWQDALDTILKSHGLKATRKGNTVLISTAGAAATPKAADQPRVRVTARPDGTLDLDASGADVHDAVRELAAATRMNIVTSKDITGTVTASLRGLSPRDTLAALADSCGAAITEKGQVILLVPRGAAAAPIAAPPSAPAKARETVHVERRADGKFTLRADQADLRELLTQFAAASGLNIVAAPQLEGTVSLQLDAVESQDVLSALSTHSNLTFRPVGAILYAAPAPPPTLATEAFRLRYAKAEDLAKALTACADGAKVAVEPSNNILIVTGQPAIVATARAIVEKADVAPVQVTIEARILETNLTGDKHLGIDWSDSFSITATCPEIPHSFPLSSNSTNSYIPGYDPGDTRNRGDLAVPFITPDDFKFGFLTASGLTMMLHMLQEESSTRLLANPTITTVEHQEAKINIVTKYPIAKYQVSSETGVLTVSGFEYQEFGTILEVTPRVSDGHIVLDVHPEISRQNGTTSFQGAVLPIVDSQETNTRVRIKDGDTLVIAGLIREDTENSSNGVPVLSKIPLIGYLFRSSRKKVDMRRNLLIFITPHIVGPDDFARDARRKAEATEPLPASRAPSPKAPDEPEG